VSSCLWTLRATRSVVHKSTALLRQPDQRVAALGEETEQDRAVADRPEAVVALVEADGLAAQRLADVDEGAAPADQSVALHPADRVADDHLSAGAFIVAVPLIETDGRVVRATISLDKGTLAAIDAAASTCGLTRSAFLAEAAAAR
jgi:hypothetical protein